MVVALLGAVFFLFLGVMMILSGEEDTWELTLMCAAFAAAFAAGAWFARRSAKSVIEYDAEGVRLLRPGKPVVLRWDEVTGLRLDNPGRLAIIGAAGRIRFDLGWKGWQQLADYARAHAEGAVDAADAADVDRHQPEGAALVELGVQIDDQGVIVEGPGELIEHADAAVDGSGAV